MGDLKRTYLTPRSPADDDTPLAERTKPWISVFGNVGSEAWQAKISPDGKLFLPNEEGTLVESNDFERFGRIAFQALRATHGH